VLATARTRAADFFFFFFFFYGPAARLQYSCMGDYRDPSTSSAPFIVSVHVEAIPTRCVCPPILSICVSSFEMMMRSTLADYCSISLADDPRRCLHGHGLACLVTYGGTYGHTQRNKQVTWSRGRPGFLEALCKISKSIWDNCTSVSVFCVLVDLSLFF
jgi:hypothetical protein